MNELYPGCVEGWLPSGLRVLAVPMDHVHSAAMGVWIRVGSRHDPPGQQGLAHVLEHMVFKGTQRRSALEIAQVIDTLGGHLNGATNKETTFYFTSVLDEGFTEGLSVITDLVSQPRLLPQDLERERTVILEEIRGVEDAPEDVVFELLAARLWGADHPLGWPVSGSRQAVTELTHPDLVAHFQRSYVPSRSVLVACGSITPDELLEEAEQIPWGDGHDNAQLSSPPTPAAGLTLAERDIQQVHIAMGFPTVPATDPRRHTVELLSSLLGGGVSSRLFQRVREERGLLYTVFSGTSYYSDAGALSVYAACDNENLEQVLDLIWAELTDMAQEPPDARDLDRAKRRLRSGFLLGQEEPAGRMARLGTAASLGLPLLPPQEILARLDRIGASDVQELAAATFRPERAVLSLVGRSAAFMERAAGRLVEVDG